MAAPTSQPPPASDPEAQPPKKSRKSRKSAAKTLDSPPTQRDEFIMDTNNSSIVSKRSVEKLYYPDSPEYLRYFVSKFKRRSPLINRGYWLRMKAIEHTAERFLAEPTTKRKVVVNLGCGYDPLPFMCISKNPALCEGAVFVDVDYPKLMLHKVGVVDSTEQIQTLLRGYERKKDAKTGLLATSEGYMAIGCDMNSAEQLRKVLEEHLMLADPETAILFIAEVSIAYMERGASQAVLEWAAGYADATFCLLEQHLPDGDDHPFAQTMLAHFKKLRTPLNAIGTLDQMRQRFLDAGFPEAGINLRTLWQLWADPDFLTDEQRRALDKIEPFDEWEEFALFGAHYFLMVAKTRAGQEMLDADSIHASSTNVQNAYVTKLSGSNVSRRFAALIPAKEGEGTIGLLAGLGAQERRTDCDTYSLIMKSDQVNGPPLRTGLQCHTACQIGNTRDVLVVGGRSAPDKASVDCWKREGNVWSRSHPLPGGRYRHNAVAVTLPTTAEGVLIFGGKTSSGDILDDWLIWTVDGWQQLQVRGDLMPARFGASMITDVHSNPSGILVGGMDRAGRVLNDLYHWSMDPDLTVHCQNITSRAQDGLRESNILGRFGAQLVRSDAGALLVGGICANRMLTSDEEVLNLRTFQTHPLQEHRPMLIGCSTFGVDDGLLVLGGGATCFSFGTYWNQPCFISLKARGACISEWRMLHQGNATLQNRGETHELSMNGIAGVGHSKKSHVPRVELDKGIQFEPFLDAGKPTVFTGGSIGSCTTSWDAAYLTGKIGVDRKVVVHMSPTSRMDFQKKDFEYTTKAFGEFIDGIARGERMYLRALSQDAPSDKATNLADDFPEIAADFKLPAALQYVSDRAHSSPLRISGPVNMWMHYDVMANVLCQVRGRKRVLLYPPTDVGNLDFAAGASSSSLNAFHPDDVEKTKLSQCHRYEALLEPGDILFIPPMWIHAAEPREGMSIAVNVFFRSFEEHCYAAGRDVYGNRDLAAYERGRKDVGRIIKSFQDLPADISGFYLERLATELLEEARRVSRNARVK